MSHRLAIEVVMPYGTERVRVGDIVFFYAHCAMQSHPEVAVIQRIHEEGMVDLLSYPLSLHRSFPRTSVVLYGDQRLETKTIRDVGCWMPRPSAEILLNKG
jgi:hypothetical protein